MHNWVARIARKMLCNEGKYKCIVPVRVHGCSVIAKNIRHYFSFLLFFFAHQHSMQRNVMDSQRLLIYISIKVQKNDFLMDSYWIFVLFFLSFC